MKAYYSLIKVVTNIASGDSLTVGILLRDINGFRYEFSKSKKQLAKGLLTNPSFVDFIEKQIIQKVIELNKNLSSRKEDLHPYKASIEFEYFNYLNNYNNGVIQFSKPAIIDDIIDSEKFYKLYELFVDKSGKKEIFKNHVLNKEFFKTIDEDLIKEVKGIVHTKTRFDNNIVPSLVSPFEIDCIGLNGVFTGAKALPMNQSRQTVSAHTNSYINIIVHLSMKYDRNLKNNNFYLVSDEPLDISSPEHEIWEKLNKEQLFKIVPSEEVYKIVEKIEETGASKFLTANKN